MCARTEQEPGPTWEVLGRHFGVGLFKALLEGTGGEIRPTDALGFIRARQGRGEVARGRWGLVGPGMDLQTARKYATFNARAETVQTSRTFAEAYRLRRCLVPLSAFWEWPQDATGRKIRTRISRVDGRPLVVAGLWSAWRDDEGEHESVTVITVPAGEDLAYVHDRQPLLLLSRDWFTWLGLEPGARSTAAQALLSPSYPAGVLLTTPA